MRLVLGVLAALPLTVQAAAPYCLTLLSAAPGRKDLPAAEAERIQKEHLAHLGALAAERWLVAAGPILTPGTLRGILVSACSSVEEADRRESADPAVRAGRLVLESFLWSGPAGIGERYRREKAADPARPDRMLHYALVLLFQAGGRTDPSRDLLMAHSAHMRSLEQNGKLAASGDITGAPGRLAAFVFQNVTRDEARQLAEQDPLVIRGYARPEAYEWLAADGTF